MGIFHKYFAKRYSSLHVVVDLAFHHSITSLWAQQKRRTWSRVSDFFITLEPLCVLTFSFPLGPSTPKLAATWPLPSNEGCRPPSVNVDGFRESVWVLAGGKHHGRPMVSDTCEVHKETASCTTPAPPLKHPFDAPHSSTSLALKNEPEVDICGILVVFPHLPPPSQAGIVPDAYVLLAFSPPPPPSRAAGDVSTPSSPPSPLYARWQRIHHISGYRGAYAYAPITVYTKFLTSQECTAVSIDTRTALARFLGWFWEDTHQRVWVHPGFFILENPYPSLLKPARMWVFAGMGTP